jgi:hypothetical protein
VDFCGISNAKIPIIGTAFGVCSDQRFGGKNRLIGDFLGFYARSATNSWQPVARASAFIFFSIKIPLKTTWFEEKIHHKVESNQRFAVEHKKEKTRFCTETCLTANLRLDLAVKIFFQNLVVSRNMKVNADALNMSRLPAC